MGEIKCYNCGESPPNQEGIELASDGTWICQVCGKKEISLRILNFIRERIAVNRTEDEDPSKFVLRELVQNADDANASILVVRFEEDGLYVANDGFAFRTAPKEGGPDDFVRAAQILERHKEGDKEAAGHFGSGFQTVYSITNSPEVYSNGYSRALNPITGRWENLDSHRYSPYMSNPPGHKGVLFRLPWRDSSAARLFYEGKQHFLEERFWPRWDAMAIRTLYDELRQYLHPVLLCCQRLLTIRIVWMAGGRREAYQATRDFTLNEPLPQPKVVEVREGSIAAKPEWFEWDGGLSATSEVPSSFSQEAEFEETKRRRYFASSGLVTESGVPVFLVREKGGSVTVSRSDAGEIKKNHIHLLFPLFVSGKAFLYSVIPLPRRGGNYFAFSAHLYPIEARNDVDVQGNGGMNGRWYRSCMLSLAKLFKDTFPGFIEFAKGMDASDEEKQCVILQALPRNEIREWMRPGKSTEDIEWARAETEALRSWLFEQPILLSAAGWFPPANGYIPEDENLEALEALKLPMFPKAFVEMFDQVPWLKILGEARKFSPEKFVDIISRSKLTDVSYNSTFTLPDNGVTLRLDRQTVSRLVTYAMASGDGATELGIFPSEEGSMRPLSCYPKLPAGFEVVYELLPAENRIHKELESVIAKLEVEYPSRRKPEQTSRLPKLLADAIKNQPARFKILSIADQRLLSLAVVKIVLDENFAEDVARGQDFLPCRFRGAVTVGPVNVARRPEDYQRGWVFAERRTKIPGLTEEVAAGIRFLALEGVQEKDVEKIETKLTIRQLAELDGKPTNYVRHFLSGKDALFYDHVLGEFLETKDRKLLDSQKRALLEALKAYFTGFTEHRREKTEIPRKEMGSVPCLYDTYGKWYPAREFAKASGPLQALFKCRTLHPDFDSWSLDTLYAIGVETEFTPEVISEKIKKEEESGNRKSLADAFGAVLVGCKTDELRKLREQLIGVKWVPVGLTQKATLDDSLYPTEALKNSLGAEHDRYVDLDLIKHDVRAGLDGMDTKSLEQRLGALGMDNEPKLEDLTLTLVSCAEKGREPPSALLKELNRRLATSDATERRDWGKSIPNPAFYWKGTWYASDEIRVLDNNEELPTAPPAGTLILSPEEADPFKSYLESIGVHRGLGAIDLLRWLREFATANKASGKPLEEQREKYDSIVKKLEPLADMITKEEAKEFGAQKIALTEQSWLAPEDLLMDDCNLIVAPVYFGDFCIVPRDSVPWRLFETLGGRIMSKLDGEAAHAIMRRLARIEYVSDNQSAAYLKMLAYGAKSNWWRAEEPLPWPVVPVGGGRFVQPSEGYLMNQAAADFFVGLPILKTPTGDGVEEELEELAGKWGAKGAGEIRYPKLDMSDESQDYEMKRLLSDIHSCLVEVFSREKASLAWIGRTEVYNTKEKFQRYQCVHGTTVDDGNLRIPAILPRSSDSAVMVLPDSGPKNPRDMAKLISSWSLGAGFPEARQDLLEKQIEFLYVERQKAFESELYVNQQIPGYLETNKKLEDWYGFCQICGWRTPSDEMGSTKESIQSIVSEKGGLFVGPLTRYEVGNSLYLCPRHAILKGRRLVRFDFMKDWESSQAEVATRIRKALEDIPEEDYRIPVSVYEWNVSNGEKEGWRQERLTLNPKHAKALYERLLRYIDTKK
jgi:hypothetical protein